MLFGIGKTKASNQFKRIAASLYKVGLFVNKIIMKNRKRKPLDKRSRLLRLKFKLGFRLFEKVEQMLMLLTLRKKPCFSDDIINEHFTKMNNFNKVDSVPLSLTQAIVSFPMDLKTKCSIDALSYAINNTLNKKPFSDFKPSQSDDTAR